MPKALPLRNKRSHVSKHDAKCPEFTDRGRLEVAGLGNVGRREVAVESGKVGVAGGAGAVVAA